MIFVIQMNEMPLRFSAAPTFTFFCLDTKESNKEKVKSAKLSPVKQRCRRLCFLLLKN